MREAEKFEPDRQAPAELPAEIRGDLSRLFPPPVLCSISPLEAISYYCPLLAAEAIEHQFDTGGLQRRFA
jgi:hypothetical protein